MLTQCISTAVCPHNLRPRNGGLTTGRFYSLWAMSLLNMLWNGNLRGNMIILGLYGSLRLVGW